MNVQVREVAQWLTDAGYPIDFTFDTEPPLALWEAVVDVIHEDVDGNYHGNELTRDEVAAWLVDP